jgi:hypothetical protein
MDASGNEKSAMLRDYCIILHTISNNSIDRKMWIKSTRTGNNSIETGKNTHEKLDVNEQGHPMFAQR